MVHWDSVGETQVWVDGKLGRPYELNDVMAEMRAPSRI